MTATLPVDPHRLPAPGGPYRQPLTVGGLSGVPDQGAAARCSLDQSCSSAVALALDTTEYEIDLSDENAAAMREALSRYVKAARKVSSSEGRPAAQPVKPAYSFHDPAVVRA